MLRILGLLLLALMVSCGSPNQPPIAKFDSTQASYPNSAKFFFTSLSRDVDGRIVNHVWYINDTRMSESSNPSFDYIFANEGRYRVKLVVTDNKGNKSSTSKTVTYFKPKPKVETAISAADGLNLEVLASLVQNNTGDLKNLEFTLNDPEAGYNNIDLDQDGEVDWISVDEEFSGDSSIVHFRVNENGNIKDVAQVRINKSAGYATVEVHGSPHYYPPSTRIVFVPPILWTSFGMRTYFVPSRPIYRSAYRVGYYPTTGIYRARPYRAYNRVSGTNYRTRTVTKVTKTTNYSRGSASKQKANPNFKNASFKPPTKPNSNVNNRTTTAKQSTVRDPNKAKPVVGSAFKTGKITSTAGANNKATPREANRPPPTTLPTRPNSNVNSRTTSAKQSTVRDENKAKPNASAFKTSPSAKKPTPPTRKPAAKKPKARKPPPKRKPVKKNPPKRRTKRKY